MRSTTFRLPTDDGVELFVNRWEPDAQSPKAVLVIAHGMVEHAARYARVAEALTAAGYVVYGHDHRGHGQSVRAPGDLGYFGDHDGWQRLVNDLHRVRERAAADYPNQPLFMLGHSMGSMVLRSYLAQHGAGLAGAVLSSTNGAVASASKAGLLIARVERLRLGPRGRSKLLDKLAFGAHNRQFKPARTDFDWLSRDAAEVDKYVADPLCGFAITVQGWIDLLGGIVAIERPDTIGAIPHALPLYLFAGDRDPVGNNGRGVQWLIAALERAGVTDVTHRFYPGGRHEMLNEENRDEVQRDLIAWLDATLARHARSAA
jgi:alpha-beta hydrolase superfamily lysophospholipase